MKKLIITAFVAVASLISVNANAQTTTTPGTIPAAVENPNQADISFEKETHEFGTIPQGVPASYTFVFKNSGKEPLIITNAAAGCGCTSPEWTKEPIKPGQKGYVKATYNAASPGPFNKTVTVMSNGKKSNVILYIKGDVKPVEAPKQ
jgi:archaellum component FlaG (FlaF/FlaG flagellin family)